MPPAVNRGAMPGTGASGGRGASESRMSAEAKTRLAGDEAEGQSRVGGWERTRRGLLPSSGRAGERTYEMKAVSVTNATGHRSRHGSLPELAGGPWCWKAVRGLVTRCRGDWQCRRCSMHGHELWRAEAARLARAAR